MPDTNKFPLIAASIATVKLGVVTVPGKDGFISHAFSKSTLWTLAKAVTAAVIKGLLASLALST